MNKIIFDEKIMNEGFEYFKNGFVTEFSYVNDTIYAIVIDNIVNEVYMKVVGNDIQNATCTCLYARGKNNCPHMSAAFFYYKEINEQKEKEDYITRLLVNTDVQIIRSYLNEKLNTDGSLLTNFKMFLNEGIDSNDGQYYENLVTKIVLRYGILYEFLDVAQIKGLVMEFIDIIELHINEMLKKRYYSIVIDIIEYMLMTASKLPIHDNEGHFYFFLEHCNDIWYEIADNAGNKVRNNLVMSLKKLMEDENIQKLRLEEYIRSSLLYATNY